MSFMRITRKTLWGAFFFFIAASAVAAGGQTETASVETPRTKPVVASTAGLEIIGEYGPAEPSPAVIFQLVKTEPVLVIDNYHGPAGQPVAEAAGVPRAVLLNFPGKDGTKTLEDLFRYNADILLKAAVR
jgi:hypothetical protein